MNSPAMHDHELIDFLLGELDPERAAAFEQRLAKDPELAREAERYGAALGILRDAAHGAEWAPARTPLLRLVLRSSVVAAALLLVAVGVFWMGRGGQSVDRIFEPDGVYGALLPEELGADGSTLPAPESDGYRLRAGAVRVSAIGARDAHPLAIGDAVIEESELTCGAARGACLALPEGGLLFLRPLSTIQLRSRRDGHTALRLLSGEAATVAGSEPLHIAIDGTDLLVTQRSGAALLRRQESDVLCLRGEIELHVETGGRWRLPEGHRLPAACAHAPQSEPFQAEQLELDWYHALTGRSARHTTITLDPQGNSKRIDALEGALLYVRARSRDATTLRISFGDGEPRTFDVRASKPLEIRIPLARLGRGPILRITPPHAVRQVRLLELD